MTLTELKENWQDIPEYHKYIHEYFIELVNADYTLSTHRDYVQDNIYGLGERSFQYAWKLILETLPPNPRMYEIGVLKGQIISLWKLLRPDAEVWGITPMDSTGDVWDIDYAEAIRYIHEVFDLDQPNLIKGLSEEPGVIQQAKSLAPFQLGYIDGGHERRHIDNDLEHYAPLIEKGGWLVIDDACCDMDCGHFPGIKDVTDGTLAYMSVHPEWEFYFNVMHLRIYRRK